MSKQSQHLLYVVGQQPIMTICMQTRQSIAHDETTITIKRKQPGNIARVHPKSIRGLMLTWRTFLKSTCTYYARLHAIGFEWVWVLAPSTLRHI